MRFDLALLREHKPYFRDVYDHAMRVNEMADTLREVLATALDCKSLVISCRRTKHQTLSSVGHDNRRTYSDNWHLRHELEFMPDWAGDSVTLSSSAQSPWCAAGYGWGSSGRAGFFVGVIDMAVVL